MPAATVTTGAKPHGQQQLARDLEVERAVMGTRIGPSVKDSAIAASCDEPLAAGRVGRTPRGGSTHLVPATTVTTGAKPHGQQQLARDLEVECAVMGSAVGLKVSARCSDAM